MKKKIKKILSLLDKKSNYKDKPLLIKKTKKILLFYKPPFYNMATNIDFNKDTSEKSKKKSFIYYIKEYLYDNYKIKSLYKNQYNNCHRIDIQTSGIIMVSKRNEDWLNCREIFHKKDNMIKIYICLVNGLIKKKRNGFIETFCNIKKGLPVMCNISNKKRYNRYVSQYCKSYYKVIKVYKYKKKYYSLVMVRIFTGRTHQIRIHMKYYLGNSIVSDDRYTTKKEINNNKKIINRVFLHNIFLSYYYDEKQYNIYCNLSLPLQKALDKMELIKSYKYKYKNFYI